MPWRSWGLSQSTKYLEKLSTIEAGRKKQDSEQGTPAEEVCMAAIMALPDHLKNDHKHWVEVCPASDNAYNTGLEGKLRTELPSLFKLEKGQQTTARTCANESWNNVTWRQCSCPSVWISWPPMRWDIIVEFYRNKGLLALNEILRQACPDIPHYSDADIRFDCGIQITDRN